MVPRSIFYCIPVFCIELPEGYTIIPEFGEELHIEPESCESANSDSAQPPAGVEAPVVEMPPEIPAAAVIPEASLANGNETQDATSQVLPIVTKRQRRESKRIKHHKRRKKKTKIPIKRLKIKPLPPPPTGMIILRINANERIDRYVEELSELLLTLISINWYPVRLNVYVLTN